MNSKTGLMLVIFGLGITMLIILTTITTSQDTIESAKKLCKDYDGLQSVSVLSTPLVITCRNGEKIIIEAFE